MKGRVNPLSISKRSSKKILFFPGAKIISKVIFYKKYYGKLRFFEAYCAFLFGLIKNGRFVVRKNLFVTFFILTVFCNASGIR